MTKPQVLLCYVIENWKTCSVAESAWRVLLICSVQGTVFQGPFPGGLGRTLRRRQRHRFIKLGFSQKNFFWGNILPYFIYW